MKKTLLIFGAGIAIPVLLMLLSVFFGPAALFFFSALFAFPAMLALTGKPVFPVVYGALSAVGLFFLFGWFGVAIGIIGAIAGIYIGNSVKQAQPLKSTLITASFGFGILFVALILLFQLLFDKNAIDSLFTLLTDTTTQLMNQTAAQTAVNPDILSDITKQMQLMFAQLKLQFPALLCVYAILFGYLTLCVLSLLHTAFRYTPRFIPHFSRFRCSRMTVWVYLLSSFGTMLFAEGSVLCIVFLNIYVITRFLLLFSALSLVDYWMKSKKCIGILRALAIGALAFIASSSFISLILNILAFIDARANFRGLEE